MEFATNHLLFVYGFEGQVWGQWDTPLENLPRYKTASDRRSPAPPEPAFTEWKAAYRDSRKAFPKSFSNLSEAFTKLSENPSESFQRQAHGVVVGGGGGGGGGKVLGEASGLGPKPLPSGDLWVGTVCDRHPKVKDRVLAEQALMDLAGNPEFDRDEFDRSHLAWCGTSGWSEKNGTFAPVLAQWIYDRGYRRMPEGTNSKQAQIDAEWEALENR
jgi:hypothetical protein